MKTLFKIYLVALIIILLPPSACFAGQKQIWKKTIERVGGLTKEMYQLVPRGKNNAKKERCNIIIYEDGARNQQLIINAYDKNQQGKIFIQEIKIAKDQGGSVEKKDERWEQECAGG